MDPAAGPVARFAVELRKLRDEAGGITYRGLAGRTGYSVTALSQAAAGEKLPSLALTLAYARACGGDVEEWEGRWRAVVREESEAAAADEEPTDAPYRGLARFEAGDADLFFGRDHLTDHLAQLVRQHRVTVVFGPSGSGKSSLLRAGLIPHLRQTKESGLRPAAIRILTPGAHPLRIHADVLVPAAAEGETWLVVDQFEEVFTLCPDPAERAEFINQLLAAKDPHSRRRVVLGVRADFYARCLEHPELAAVIAESSLPVPPMSTSELREVIVKPAAAEGLIVERALTAHLIEEVGGEPGALPLLSHVLLETWRRRRGRTLTLQAYESAGGIHGSIAQSAESVYTQLAPAQAETARRILLCLITPGDDTPDTRRPIDVSELEEDRRTDTRTVLDLLARARLVILEDTTVDLAHEALITSWPRLHGWIEQDRERLRAHRRLTEAARAWAELDQDSGALYRGIRLASAEEHLPHPHLTSLERAFLNASVAARDHEQHAAARTTRRLRQFSIAVSGLLVLALTAGVLAWQQSRASDRQRARAVAAQQTAISRQLAAQSSALMATDPDLASLLAVRAYRTAPTGEATTSLYAAADLARQYHLPAYATPVLVTAFSPDIRTLATADEKTVRLWDTATGKPRRTLTGHTRAVSTMAFSSDGRTLATADENAVRLWDTATGKVRRTLPSHGDVVSAMAFSPDAHTLAVGDGGGRVRLWGTTTGTLRRTLTGHPGYVSAVVFRADGNTLATVGEENGDDEDGHDRAIRIWNMVGGKTESTISTYLAGSFRIAAFSKDGRTLATTGYDEAVELWDTGTGKLRRPLTGHARAVSAVVFSPDGNTLATADEKEVRLWNVDNGTLRRSLPFPSNSILTTAFSPDGNTLTAVAGTGVVRAWDVTEGRPRRTLTGHTGEASEVVFSPGGDTLATADEDAVRLWDVSNGRLRRTLRAPGNDMVGGMAFSPGGDALAVSDAGTVRLWDSATGRTRRILTGHDGDVSELVFSPVKDILATADRAAVRLWDVTEGKLRRTLSF
ncbi:hypothetical protein AB0B50_43985, partial [Streptomyces sp. NPDC041068]|uniref:nSTAND1 domain-containing NTPase n=1 Tax=Streptomyces sp. NPDC041068 TaxID=3155130 RepID=UPI00340DFD36